MIIVPQPQRRVTERSSALAERLRQTIAEFQAREPKVTADEIASALWEASLARGAVATRRIRVMLAAMAAALLAAGGAIASERAKETGSSSMPTAWIAIGIVVIGIIAVVALRSRNND